MENLKKLLDWLKSQKGPAKWIGTIAIIGALVAYLLSSCTVTHKVVQSAYNTTTGDSIVIRYEQTGKGLKR